MPCQPALALTFCLPLAGGCSTSTVFDGGFDATNSSARMYATQQAVEREDAEAIERIIEQLESDDPAVRWLAIRSLERMTGRTNGYRDSDPPDERRAAVARWRADLAEGRLTADAGEDSTEGSTEGTTDG